MAGDLSNILTRGILKKANTMKNKDFKAIYVLNYLISIRLPLKKAQDEVFKTKYNKLYI